MRRLVVAALVLCMPAYGWAESQDLVLAQLGNPATDNLANQRFEALMNEMGVAIGSWNLEPPETTGFSGFNFAFEYPIAFVNGAGKLGGSRYWAWESNQAIDNLQMPGFHIRKGLPFSFEAGAKVNYINQSNMVAATVEAKWSLNEGFLYFPDLGVRGFGTQLIGAREFNLTTAGFDVGIGHQFPIAGMFTLTPYGGWTSIWVSASSNVIDFKPQLSESDQFKDNASGTSTTNVFDSVDIGSHRHNRYYLGLRFISYIVEVGVEASLAQVKTTGSDYDVITYSGKVGLDF